MSGAGAVVAYIGFGSNIGNRRQSIYSACVRLLSVDGVASLRLTALRETDPVGTPEAPALGGPYLNAVGEVRTTLPPCELLERCLRIEDGLGRVRSTQNAPRCIDLDILLYDDQCIELSDQECSGKSLVVPHPRMLERLFVLEPLVELCPERRHPLSRKTMREHLESMRAQVDPGANKRRLRIEEADEAV